MAIELISTITPKNNGGFAIALAHDIQGGLHSVDSIDERDAISKERLAEGMLCYVANDKMYQYTNGSWSVFSMSSIVVNTLEERNQINTDNLPLATLCYVIEDTSNNYMYYYSVNGWRSLGSGDRAFGRVGGGYYFGTTPPEDTSLLWIDPTYEMIDKTITSVVLGEIRESFKELKTNVNDLKIEVTLNKVTINNLKLENTTLKSKLSDLEYRVSVLEKGGGGNNNGNTGNISGDVLLTEDGLALLCEDGTYLLIDNVDTIPTDALLSESGNPLLTENNEYILHD